MLNSQESHLHAGEVMSKTSIEQIVSRETERLSAYLRADKKSELTVDLYARSIDQMLRVTGKAPDQLTPEDMQKFLVYVEKLVDPVKTFDLQTHEVKVEGDKIFIRI